MPDVHVPDFGGHHGSGRSFLKLALEVLLIAVGVFLGLAGEQWRENVRHRELAHQSLERFRQEFRLNRAEVVRVHDRHVQQMKGLEAYFRQYDKELSLHTIDRSKPIPGPIPDTVTDSALFDYSAWELAVATQSLAYMDPELVAKMSAAYRMQQMYEDSHRAIAQTSYSMTDVVYWLRGVMTWFGDASLYEELLLKWYDEILPRMDKAIGS